MSFCKVFGIKIAATNQKAAVKSIFKHLDEWRGQYITFVNVHTLTETFYNEIYTKAQQDAVVRFADGAPIASYERRNGYAYAKRVAGPDTMAEILEHSQKTGESHFFYGGDPKTLQALEKKLLEKYPRLQIVGMASPKFESEETYRKLAKANYIDEKTNQNRLKLSQMLDLQEEKDIRGLQQQIDEAISMMNETEADFIWVGLGAPKQELFMQAAKGRTNGLMLGVGAAFDFLAETKKRAPEWMQHAKLEWLYRMMQEPSRLGPRYMQSNLLYVCACIKQGEDRIFKK